MDQGDDFNGRMLKLARQARGMTQTQAAKAAGITQAYIHMIEDEKRPPSRDVADRIADALHFPVSFFAQSDMVIGPGVGEIFHRRRRMSAKELESFYAWMNIKIMAVRRMADAIDWPEVNLPILSLDLDTEDPEAAAEVLRGRWHVPHGPVWSISDLLDAAGILVIPERFEHPEMDGMSVWLPGLPPMIFVNQAIPQDRLRFTLMHEVGHLVLHQRSALRQLSEDIESQAHRFASAFLMPSGEIRPQLRNLTLQKLGDLKRQWRVAMSAIVMRARDLEVISPSQATEFWRDLSKRGWMKREPVQFDVKGEVPGGLFEELVKLHQEDLGYSTAKQLQSLVHLFPEDIYRRILPIAQSSGLRIVS